VRRHYQLPTTNYQLPTTNYQLPTTNYQLPTSNWQLATGNYQLATDSLPARAAELSAHRFCAGEDGLRVVLFAGGGVERVVDLAMIGQAHRDQFGEQIERRPLPPRRDHRRFGTQCFVPRLADLHIV